MLFSFFRPRSRRHADPAASSRKRQSRLRLSLEILEDRVTPAGFLVAGADFGAAPVVRVFDASTGTKVADFLAFDAKFTGGVRVAMGDVTGDSVPDIIAAAGMGGGPAIRVYSGRDLTLKASFFAFGPTFAGGVNVAVGDLNDDGVGDIVVGAGAGGGGRIRVFDVLNGTPVQIPGPLGSLSAFGAGYRGEVTVATGNVDGKRGDELIAGAGPGASSRVQIFAENGLLLRSFLAYGAGFKGGVYVAAGDVDNDGRADVITGAGSGGGPHVEVFSGLDGKLLKSFFAYGSGFQGGVRVASQDLNGDGSADLITGAGAGGSSHTRYLDGQTLAPILNFLSLPTSGSGVHVAAAAISTLGDPAAYQVAQEAPLLSRLARYVPDPAPKVSDWVAVSAADSNLDPSTNGNKSHLYVIAHGWAPGYLAMVQANGTPVDPLKWWQTLDTSLAKSPGRPASTEMFYGAAGDNIAITPTGLALAITQADPAAVVLAYSWIDNSATSDTAGVPTGAYLSEAYTAMNGTRLAEALEQALPSTFAADGGLLHVIGHSHGSKVATVATLVLTQSGNTNYRVEHLTILDSPEDANSFVVRQGDAANNLWYFLGGINVGKTAGKTFVDNYISAFDTRLGVVQGYDPFNTSTTTSVLQQIVDANLNPGVLYNAVELGSMHSYAFNWYAGGSLTWAQNPTPNVANRWSPLVDPSKPATLAGSYTQSWTKENQPQFALTAGPGSNTVTDTPTFTNLAYKKTTISSGSSFNANTGAVTLTEDGSSTATFTGKFSPESDVGGISFNYQFSNVGAGDQLVISVDTGAFFAYKIYFVMTGTVAGTSQMAGTLTLASLASSIFDHTVQIQLIPASGSTGASVTVTKLQQFTS